MMRRVRSLGPFALILLLAWNAPITAAGAANPEGQMTWAVHISLAPTWFDPAETPGIATPFMVLYALHDAMVKPMPGQAMASSLADSWSASKDGLTYEFLLRHGVKFHNGDPVTADDVKFSFERYRGAAARLMKDAATRLEVFVASGGPYVYGSYPDVDGLFREQAGELDRKRREAMLHRIQQLIHDKAMYAPIWELGFVHAQGPRVTESGLGLITGWAFSAPYEDVKLKGQ